MKAAIAETASDSFLQFSDLYEEKRWNTIKSVLISEKIAAPSLMLHMNLDANSIGPNDPFHIYDPKALEWE